jgi:transcriptional regulator with XRE-family HTH domain
MVRERFGTRLRSLRERAGMTQTQLGAKVGVSQGNIATWERNGAIPQLGMVERLAAVLNASAVELLKGQPPPPPKPTKRTIRLTADKFADYLPTDYAASLVQGFTVPADGIDVDDWIVSKLVAWVARENERSPDVRYEISRHVAAILLERLARNSSSAA